VEVPLGAVRSTFGVSRRTRAVDLAKQVVGRVAPEGAVASNRVETHTLNTQACGTERYQDLPTRQRK